MRFDAVRPSQAQGQGRGGLQPGHQFQILNGNLRLPTLLKDVKCGGAWRGDTCGRLSPIIKADCRHRRTPAPTVEVSSQVIQGPRNPIERRRPAGNGAERPECAAKPALRRRVPDAGNSVGSRRAAIRLVVAISSALANRFAKSLRKEGTVSAAMCGRRKHVQNLLLGDGGLEQAGVLINPANDEKK
jgi:hypothetical protein